MTIRSSSRFRSLRSLAATAALAVIGTSAALAAPVTFAQYFQSDGAQQQWTVTNSGTTTTVSAFGAVSFNFSGVSGLPFAGPENALFTLLATSNQIGNCGNICGASDSYVDPGFAGTFSFIDNGGGFAQGTNLLSGTFAVTGSPATTGAQFGSTIGGTGGSFRASANSGNLLQLVMTSNYLNFVGQTEETASWSLSSLIPNFAVGTVIAGQAFSSGTFNASGTGTFSSNPGPENAAPEPASMGLIGSGLCGVAFVMRRRTRLTAAGR